MTSADAIRLSLIAAQEADQSTAADARIVPTVTLPLEEHVGTVYRYAVRLCGRVDAAEDLTQETLLRAWSHREQLRDERTARVWLLRIATNVWTDGLRQCKFQPHELDHEPPCPRIHAAEQVDKREQVRLALSAMDQLPPRQRQVLYLITCEQLSHAEVADVLEMDAGTVKSNLSLARKEMRRRLKEVYEAVCGRRACEENPK